jgi:hypothetical protein
VITNFIADDMQKELRRLRSAIESWAPNST